MRLASRAAVELPMKPTRGIFPPCCARAANGHAAAAPPISVINSRRLIEPPDKRCIDAQNVALRGGAAVRKGSQLIPDAATQCPRRVITGHWLPQNPRR